MARVAGATVSVIVDMLRKYGEVCLVCTLRTREVSVEPELYVESGRDYNTTRACRSPKPRTFSYVSSELSFRVTNETALYLSAVARGTLNGQ
jgi:hypothetical protein